jgi:ribosomal protein S18 acetylase RimI-like enzyme
MIFDFEKIIKNKHKFNNLDTFEEYRIKSIEKLLIITPNYFTGISENYIKSILSNNNKIKILFITIGQKLITNDIISIIIYHKTQSIDKIKYYILGFGIHKRFRKYGYGKNSLDEFIQWIKKNNKSGKEKIILLKSIESSLNFYITYGFVQTDLMSNKLFYKYEPNNELKLNQEKILVFEIN